MKVLVTGVTGYLGGRLGQRLAEAGHTVRGLARDPARWRERPAGAQAVRGDVTDFGSLRDAVAGCEAVVHAAAHVKVWDRRRHRFACRHENDVARALRGVRLDDRLGGSGRRQHEEQGQHGSGKRSHDRVILLMTPSMHDERVLHRAFMARPGRNDPGGPQGRRAETS